MLAFMASGFLAWIQENLKEESAQASGQKKIPIIMDRQQSCSLQGQKRNVRELENTMVCTIPYLQKYKVGNDKAYGRSKFHCISMKTLVSQIYLSYSLWLLSI